MKRRSAPYVLALTLFSLAACGGDAPEAEPAADVAPVPTVEPAAPPAGGEVLAANMPEGVTPAMVAEGQQLYGTICAACHGPAGEGTPLAPALNDAEWLNVSGQSFDEVIQVIHTGVPQPKQYPAPMMPMGGGNFTEDQVRSLAAYVWSISHT